MPEEKEGKLRLPDDGLGQTGGGVRSFLATLSIAEVERDWDEIKDRCFTREERSALSGKRFQTHAGFLALKKALIELFHTQWADASLGEKEFVLSHDANGAPKLVSIPQCPLGREEIVVKRLHISISHTRTWAYGLAAYQEACCD